MQTNIDKMKKKIIKNGFRFFAHFSVICIHELNWILELFHDQRASRSWINTIKAKQMQKKHKGKKSNEKSFEFLIFNCNFNEKHKKR